MKKSHYWSESILSDDASRLVVKQKYVLRYVFFVDSKLSDIYIYDTLPFSRQLRGEILFTTVRCYCCSVVVAVLLMVRCDVYHTTTLWFLDIVWSIMITDTRRRLLTMMRRWWVMDPEAEGKEELSMRLQKVSMFRYSVVVVLLMVWSSCMSL